MCLPAAPTGLPGRLLWAVWVQHVLTAVLQQLRKAGDMLTADTTSAAGKLGPTLCSATVVHQPTALWVCGICVEALCQHTEVSAACTCLLRA
jgi:hypothetical protein